jgi:hypothetical protein
MKRDHEKRVVVLMLATLLPIEAPLRVNNGFGGRSTGTSAVPQTADDFGAPRKSAEVGQQQTYQRQQNHCLLDNLR